MLPISTLLPAGDAPLYQRLYQALTGQIRSGALAAGTRLPGKRTLAAELGVSVNTVDTAYQMLAAEGYVESRPRSGFVVLPFAEELPPALPAAPVHSEPPAPPPARWRFDLGTGSADTGLFPFRTWGNRPEIGRAHV